MPLFNCIVCDRHTRKFAVSKYSHLCRRCQDYLQTPVRKISGQEYNRLQDEQGFTCGICQEPERGPALIKGRVARLSLDHEHSGTGKGKIRGLLCRNCNLGLGFFRDNIGLLVSAAAYLHRKGQPLIGAPQKYVTQDLECHLTGRANTSRKHRKVKV